MVWMTSFSIIFSTPGVDLLGILATTNYTTPKK
jgi:hypothetical protein